MIQPIWKCRTFCLDKTPAWCHQYWVVFLWKLLHPDYCSRCLELPEKRFCLTKWEFWIRVHISIWFFFFPLCFSQGWKCYFLMSFKMYNTVFNSRHSLSVETTNMNKMDRVKFCSQAWSAVQNLRFSVCRMIFKWAYPESSILFTRDRDIKKENTLMAAAVQGWTSSEFQLGCSS